MRYVLRQLQGTETFHRITQGRRWIGRVCQHADGTWLGVVGKTTSAGHPSPAVAFDEVLARHLGHPDALTMRHKQRQARNAVRVANRAADRLASELLRGNFAPLDAALRHGGDAGALLALRGMTRSLRRGRRRCR